MSETKTETKTEWVTVGVAVLSQSGKTINLLLNGINYTISVQGIQGVISGKYPTSNISKPSK